MKCIIPGPNVRMFCRAIHCLARIGEELYINPQDDELQIGTINTSHSAYAVFRFRREFFTSYEETAEEDEQYPAQDEKRRRHDESSLSELTASSASTVAANKCKLAMKSALWVFRSLAHLDKTVEAMTVDMQGSANLVMFILHCKHDATKRYSIQFLECESIKLLYNDGDLGNAFTVHSRILKDCLSQFLQNQEEVTMKMQKEKFTLKNFIEADASSAENVAHTEYTISSDQFDEYKVENEAAGMTYCLRELRALITFVDAFSLPISCGCEEGGKPVVFTTSLSQRLDASLVMATVAEASTCGGNNNMMSSMLTSPASEQNISSVPLINRRESSTQMAREGNASVNFHSPGLTPILDLDFAKDGNQRPGDDTVVQGTPPSQAVMRRYFQRCFDNTLLPSKMPGTEKVYAPDSDEEM